MADLPEALLGERIPFEDHIADDVVLMKGNGVMAMFAVAGVFPDTADEVDIAGWYDGLHNALKNIAAEDTELTIYQCRGEADRSVYEDGLHRSQFARDLGTCLSGQSVPRIAVFQPAVPGDPGACAERWRRKASRGSCPMRSRTRGQGSTRGRTGSTRSATCCSPSLACSVCAGLGYVTPRACRLQRNRRGHGLRHDRNLAPDRRETGRMGNAMFSEAIRFRHQQVEFHGAGETDLRVNVCVQGIPRRRPGRACSTGWRWRRIATR